MIKTRIRNKRDTLDNWSIKNPILLSGEIAIVDDEENIKLKIGDGVTPYNSLPFYVGNYNDLKDKPVGFTCTVKDNNTKNYHHILSSGQCKNGRTDKTITLLVTQNSNDAGLGILRCSLRTNNVKNNEVAEGEITWLIRTGFAESSFCFNLRNTPGDTYMDIFYKASSTYMGLTWYILSEGAMATDEELWTKYNTDATSGTNVYTESEMSALREYTSTLVFSQDKGVVDQANDAYWADEAYKCTKAIQDDDGNIITDTYTTKEYVENLYKKLNTNRVLGFYCIEDVTIITNGVSTVYPANSNIDIKFIEGETFEIVPTSNNSILSLTSFPGALGTYYPWLEGVKQFSNILFDMNSEDMYTKWNQGNQGVYKVQYAQYSNCIFWSDLPYITDNAKRTNYTLYYSTQLPLCYSSIPDNTFKSFYLAFNACSDPNWGNPAYRDSFSKATWATQVFSYYGARTIGIFGHDNSAFNIVLPKDCRGLMYAATAIENAGTFDAINVTNFGAKSGSWREAFGECSSLRNLYIKNLKVGINVSWSPLNYDSIYFIISKAANTSSITISVSPYTYNLLSQSDFELAASKNINIELLTTNYVEDRRLSAITITGDGSKVLSNNGTYKTLSEIGAVAKTELEDEITNKLANVSSDILPSEASTISIGSEDKKLKAIYADEVHISQNTLYIGDTPVLGTDQDTINIKAGQDQSVLVKTTGTGTTQMSSENGILLRTNGTTANININADGTNSEVTMNAKTRVSVTAPNIVLDGTTTIKDLTVTGTTTTVNSTNLAVKDNLIELNSGETGEGVTAGSAGIKVNRGDALPYLIQFDEADDMFKIGEQGDLETIASQNYVNEKIANSSYTHPTGIVTAGNYNNVTVNAEGHVIAGAKLRLMQTFSGYNQLGFEENPADIHALIAAMPINSIFTKNYSTSYSQYSLPEWGVLTITKLDNRCDLELNTIDIGGSIFKYVRTASYNLTTNTLSDWSEVNRCNVATYTEYKQLGFSEVPTSLEELILAVPSNSIFMRRITSSSETLGCPSAGILTITKAGGANTAFVTLARENGPTAEHKRYYILDWYQDMPTDKYEWRENAYLKNGAVEIAQGGTGATTAEEACVNIGALPTSGGSMTGAIISTNGYLAKRNTDDSYMQITAGTTYTKGAYLYMTGQDNSGEGNFTLGACKDGTIVKLTGKPDGTLTWNGKSLLTSDTQKKFYKVTKSTSFTASYDCIAVFYHNGAENYQYVTINGTKYNDESHHQSSKITCIPLKAGDVVSCTNFEKVWVMELR